LEPDATHKVVGWFYIHGFDESKMTLQKKRNVDVIVVFPKDVTDLTDEFNKFYANDEFDFLTEFKTL